MELKEKGGKKMKIMNLYKVMFTFKSVLKIPIPDNWIEKTEKIKNTRGLYIAAKNTDEVNEVVHSYLKKKGLLNYIENTDIRELKNFPLIIYGKKGGLKTKQKGLQYDEDVQDMICPECLEKTE